MSETKIEFIKEKEKYESIIAETKAEIVKLEMK